MKNAKQVIKYLKILGINSTDSFYDDCVNDFHNKQFSKVLNSKITKEEKNNLLIEINNAKEYLEDINLDDLKVLISNDITILEKYQEKNQKFLDKKTNIPQVVKSKENQNKLSRKLSKKKLKKSSSKMFKIIIQAEGLRSDEYSLEKSVILPEQIIIKNNFEETLATYWRDVKTKRWYKKNLKFQENDYLPYIEEYDKKVRIGSVIYTLVYYNQWISLLVGFICTFTIDFRDYETLRGIYIYVAISWIVPRFFPYFFRYD